ncbi:DUF2461 domain-containing protein [Flavobacterium gilvum]|uniref:TIGR02453 family protein n=1 Tax=Flavobacterium gilvum TaxID=1492737 RepID=A0AAC9I516_9FLAO|nr:DUF2461 domain-containing protein [Flavobacterium gilvum]AOW08042.1 TIGR02453 family protein [Flavobacterium gilvum]KFC57765.1 hypothetical protein FEM08_34800 [Flavobacterium gilvum]
MLSKDTLQFLEDLKANNNRDWFLENKKRYEAVKKDYHQLVGSLLDTLKPLDSSLEMMEVKNCVFRINRDIRFSKDKSPYKTNLGIWISPGSKHIEAPGYYLHIENENCFVGGGLYCPQPDQLQKIRKEIHFFYDDLVEILNDKKFKSIYESLSRDENSTLKNPPKGYDKEDPAIEFLKLKSFTAIQKFDTKLATQKDFVSIIAEKMIALKPFNNFIDRALSE